MILKLRRITFIGYAFSRHHSMRCGFGVPNCGPWVRWLWLDALLYALVRSKTYYSPFFRLWCRRLDQSMRVDFDWPRSYTRETGLDCWIDSYLEGLTPDEAIDEDREYWEG